MKHHTIVCTVPTWALGYLVNSNHEGLDIHEIELCANFLAAHKIVAGQMDAEGEVFIARTNDIGGYAKECIKMRFMSDLTAADMFNKVVCPVNLRYGAPMGRQSNPPKSWEGIPRYDRKVLLDSGGYDKHGAYWGLGGELRLRISKDFQNWEFYRK